MSIGSAINYITAAVGAGGNVNYQPAAQVEWCIFSFGSDKGNGAAPDTSPAIKIGLYDGVSRSWMGITGINRTHANLKLFATNSIYITINNTDAAAAIIAISGTQTK